MINQNKIPQHIGIIMDGNSRWAKQRELPTKKGHEAGAQALEKIIKYSGNLGIKTVTVYALSTENFTKRTKKEIKDLLQILKDFLIHKHKKFQRQGVKLTILGELKIFPKGLQKLIINTINSLKNNNRLKLNIALNYGGRAEIIKAVQKMLIEKKNPQKITEQAFSKALYTQGQKDPDLLIRTGGEKRLSNFLIWQLSYSELYFTDILWPDFNEKELDKAILEYQQRERRFGGRPVEKMNIEKFQPSVSS